MFIFRFCDNGISTGGIIWQIVYTQNRTDTGAVYFSLNHYRCFMARFMIDNEGMEFALTHEEIGQLIDLISDVIASEEFDEIMTQVIQSIVSDDNEELSITQILDNLKNIK
jgi:hypothetical protein